jgi:EmrB/QacA subfamily drug resistance transporter
VPTATAQTTDAPQRLTGRRLYVIIGALLLGMLLAALDQTIVATALPTIVGDLGGASHLSWIVTAYLLASTATMPLWGKLGDLYGRKTFFQAAIVIFLVGSMLSGISTSILELIVFRAIQGLGGGGLIIGAQTIIGDVVSPRDRGRYMGIFGGVFGVTSVIGPLIGGLFVDNLSWRWVFYVNLPIGIVALLVTAAVLPGKLSRVHHVIDYLGTTLIALAAVSLVLLTSLGGTSYPWNSAPIYILGACGILLIIGFVFAERRAGEPVIPLALFRNRAFAATSAVGFVVGLAMFGAITFLPLFLQNVQGVNPTVSGVRLLPLMAGLLLTSIGSGQIIARTGQYRIFPIVGTAIMAVGLFLLSRLGPGTSTALTSIYMFVFGIGLGSVMQVLVIIVQSAVDYRNLGVATSGATFFRQIGGSFGTAIFGAIFANLLSGNLATQLHGVTLPPALSGSGSNISPQLLDRLPPAVHSGFARAYSDSLSTVFLIAMPIAVVAFLLTWLIPRIELRRTTGAVDPGETFGMPEDRTSLQEVERAVTVLARRENRWRLYERLAARAGLDLGPAACWLLLRFDERSAVTLGDLARRLDVPMPRLVELADQLSERGLISEPSPAGDPDGDSARLTPAGHAAAERLVAARHQGLTDLLDGWSPDEHPELAQRLADLARELLADDRRLIEAAEPLPGS